MHGRMFGRIKLEYDSVIGNARNDLHAANARYHEVCRKKFMSQRNIPAAHKQVTTLKDVAYTEVTQLFMKGSSRMWTSVDIHEQYQQQGGAILSRQALVLANYFCSIENTPITILMEGTHSRRTVISMGKTARKHHDIIPSLLAAHALTGCDSACGLFRTGNKTAVKVMQQTKLTATGDVNASLDDGFTEATEFTGLCYGI